MFLYKIRPLTKVKKGYDTKQQNYRLEDIQSCSLSSMMLSGISSVFDLEIAIYVYLHKTTT